MSVNSSFSFRGYNIFKMDSATDLHLATRVAARSHHLSYYVAIGCVLLVVYFLQYRKHKHLDFPFYKAGLFKWMFDAENLIKDSYNKYHDKVYQIKATEGVQVLVPVRLIGELKGLPEDTLSATEAVSEAMMSKYTRFCAGDNGELLSCLIRTRLTQNLVRLVPQLKEELEYVVATEFPACDDWTSVKVQPFALRAIARLSGLAFVGPALNRDEAWMDTSINFAVHVFLAVVKLQFFPAWLRPVAQYLIPDLGRIRRDVARARAMLQPVIEERIRDMDCPGFENDRADDLVQWLLEALPEDRRTDFETQTELQLLLGAASIHTTNNLVVDCVFDLAAHPDVQEELRQEAHEVLEADGGWAKKESLSRLKKMDSFMKEVQRLAGNVTSFIRKVIKPIDLSDGTHLPPGTKLLCPQAGIARDPRFYQSPESFDPLRFFRLRQQGGEDSNRWQFTSIGDTYMNFGAGRHACPGRFFAGNVIKMVLAYLVLNYEIRLRDGEERPKSMMIMMSKTPNPNGEVMFRRRTVEA